MTATASEDKYLFFRMPNGLHVGPIQQIVRDDYSQVVSGFLFATEEDAKYWFEMIEDPRTRYWGGRFILTNQEYLMTGTTDFMRPSKAQELNRGLLVDKLLHGHK